MVYLNQDLTTAGKYLFPRLMQKFLVFTDRGGKSSLETMLKRWYTCLLYTSHTWTLGVLVRGALSMQWLKPAREFRSLIANGESLDALLAVKRRFSAYLLSEEDKDPKFRAIAWQRLLWAIWGSSSENGGSKVIKSAPKELKEKYQQVFA